jgi:type II secretory pathway component PulM
MPPALPLDEAGQYVAGAYVVFLLLILIYVAIIGAKVARIQRQVSELLELTEEDGPEEGRSPSVHARPDAESQHQTAGLEAPRR